MIMKRHRINIERFSFYDEAKTAYLLIATSEKALYANVMLQNSFMGGKNE